MSQNPTTDFPGLPQSSDHPLVEPNLSDGPRTVINPQQQAAAQPPPRQIDQPTSEIWNLLFPSDSHSGHHATGEKLSCQLGHFSLLQRIGQGGMGAVFRAIDERLDRPVALKILSPTLTHYDDAVQRFHNEAQSAARLDHDNIARVFYVGEDRGLHFIAYEFVTGPNIRDLIREHGRLSPTEAVNYTLQIATALNHTSAAGVVHRDIKPSNIIITPNGRAKLVDLGLARRQSDGVTGELTVAGTTLGTFDYISPEQAKDPRAVDVRSDIYSLGCTLYHMLTGLPPYPEGTALQKLLDHQGKEPPDPAEKCSNVSPELSAIVKRMMSSQPASNDTKTPDELIRDLMLVAGQMGLRGINPEGLIWAMPKIEKSAILGKEPGTFCGAHCPHCNWRGATVRPVSERVNFERGWSPMPGKRFE